MSNFKIFTINDKLIYKTSVNTRMFKITDITDCSNDIQFRFSGENTIAVGFKITVNENIENIQVEFKFNPQYEQKRFLGIFKYKSKVKFTDNDLNTWKNETDVEFIEYVCKKLNLHTSKVKQIVYDLKNTFKQITEYLNKGI